MSLYCVNSERYAANEFMKLEVFSERIFWDFLFAKCQYQKYRFSYFSASHTSEMIDKADAVLTSVRTKSVDSNLDFMEEAEHDTKRSYEDL